MKRYMLLTRELRVPGFGTLAPRVPVIVLRPAANGCVELCVDPDGYHPRDHCHRIVVARHRVTDLPRLWRPNPRQCI